MPLMGSPYPLLLIIAGYVLFVCKIGPAYMKHREAFDLKNVSRIYNSWQILACSVFIYVTLTHGYTLAYIWRCSAPDEIPMVEKKGIIFLGWLFVMLRMSEFFETVIFVLRKKQSQVSFLHVYHHVTVILLLWITAKYSAENHEITIVFINDAVHILMYSYYLLSSFESARKFTASAKRILTIIQIVQLMIIVAHCVITVASCKVYFTYYLQVANLTILIAMFLKFYNKAYLVKQKLHKS